MQCHDSHDTMQGPPQTPWWKSRTGIVFCGFLLIAGFYLLTEHTAHFFGVLPFVLILACPLTHMFMHHGHGGHSASTPPRAGTPRDLEVRHEP